MEITARAAARACQHAGVANPRITRALQSQFRQGVDPYGSPWAPLSPNTRGRKPPPLTDTGKLKQGTKARPGVGGRAGLHLVLGAEYGIFHQTGTRNMPARRILPTRGMPAEWRGILESRARMLARRAERVS
jgi:hypothetical protein